MEKVFLDTNILIDLVEKRREVTLDALNDADVFISPLSVHICMYVLKEKIPFERLSAIIQSFSIVDFTNKICKLALSGPTNDFEDNVQLHSAAESECEMFFTSDKKLQDMKFFGKVRITAGQD